MIDCIKYLIRKYHESEVLQIPKGIYLEKPSLIRCLYTEGIVINPPFFLSLNCFVLKDDWLLGCQTYKDCGYFKQTNHLNLKIVK